MKIKLTQITISIMLLALLTRCSNNNNSSNVEQTLCGVENCNNIVVKNDYGHGVYSYGKYCEEHTCKEDSCGGMVQNNGDYCSIHTEKQITLSDEQLIEVRQVADEYINQLMSIHSNLLAINLINDYPEYVSEYSCSFRCNVVREDDNTNLATIYLSINSDGSFEVDRLMYDE